MDIVIDFPGGLRVDGHVGAYVVHSDQPVDVGGDGSAPSPYTLFLASLATCAGFYVVNFCRKRDISTEGMRIVQHAERDPATGLATNITLDIQLPSDFPEKYTSALVRAAEQCLVKKQLDHPPVFEIRTNVGEPVAS